MMNKYRMMLFQFSDGKGGNNLEKNSQPVRKFVLCISKKKKPTHDEGKIIQTNTKICSFWYCMSEFF